MGISVLDSTTPNNLRLHSSDNGVGGTECDARDMEGYEPKKWANKKIINIIIINIIINIHIVVIIIRRIIIELHLELFCGSLASYHQVIPLLDI